MGIFGKEYAKKKDKTGFVCLFGTLCLFIKTFYDKLWSTHERAHQPLVMF
jgi:hypothetical protein